MPKDQRSQEEKVRDQRFASGTELGLILGLLNEQKNIVRSSLKMKEFLGYVFLNDVCRDSLGRSKELYLQASNVLQGYSFREQFLKKADQSFSGFAEVHKDLCHYLANATDDKMVGIKGINFG